MQGEPSESIATTTFDSRDSYLVMPHQHNQSHPMAAPFYTFPHHTEEDDSCMSEACSSSLGTRSLPEGKCSTANLSPATLLCPSSSASSSQAPSSMKPFGDRGEEDDHEHVTINLSSGEDLFAKPYDNSVSGHHVMLKQEGQIWKATRSHREERFYVTMTYCTGHHLEDGSPSLEQDDISEQNLSRFLGEEIPNEEVIRSAQLIAPYVPRFYGMRQVRKLRCAHDQVTPITMSNGSSSTLNSAFPSSPPSGTVRYDAALHHTAEQLVASFEHAFVEQFVATSSSPGLVHPVQSEHAARADSSDAPDAECRASEMAAENVEKEEASKPSMGASAPTANPALRRNTILPHKPPEEGRPLDHRLPRTIDQLVDMIVLEDICHGFVHPCVLDLKMGTRQYGVKAPEEKKKSKSEKARRSTSFAYGLRVSGFKRWNPKTKSFEAKGKHECFGFTAQQVEDTLFQFCGGDPGLLDRFSRITQKFEDAFRHQTAFRFFTSSVLLVYDGNSPHATARLVMVDFAYTYRGTELIAVDDENAAQTVDVGYMQGIESLNAMLSHALAKSLQVSAAPS